MFAILEKLFERATGSTGRTGKEIADEIIEEAAKNKLNASTKNPRQVDIPTYCIDTGITQEVLTEINAAIGTRVEKWECYLIGDVLKNIAGDLVKEKTEDSAAKVSWLPTESWASLKNILQESLTSEATTSSSACDYRLVFTAKAEPFDASGLEKPAILRIVGSDPNGRKASWEAFKAIAAVVLVIGLVYVVATQLQKRTKPDLPESTIEPILTPNPPVIPPHEDSKKQEIRLPIATAKPLDLKMLRSEVFFAKGSVMDNTRFGRAAQVQVARNRAQYVLVYFWATWCKPCIDEMPDMNELAGKLSKDFQFIGVADERGTRDSDYREPWNRISNIFVQYENLSSQYLLDKGKNLNNEVFGRHEVALPAFALFDRSGRLVSIFHGSIKSDVGKRHLQLMQQLIWMLDGQPSNQGPGNE